MSALSRYIVAFLACFASGLVGFVFIGTDDIAWYHTLPLPPLVPPDAVFPVLLVVVYASAALALGSFWSKTALWNQWIGIFFWSLLFNAAWQMFFFGFHAIFLALVAVIILSVTVLGLVLHAYDDESPALYWLIPYALWALFLLYLVGGIWVLMDF